MVLKLEQLKVPGKDFGLELRLVQYWGYRLNHLTDELIMKMECGFLNYLGHDWGPLMVLKSQWW